MTKRAVQEVRRSDDRRIQGSAALKKVVPNVKPLTARTGRVESFKQGVAGGGAGRPKKVR